MRPQEAGLAPAAEALAAAEPVAIEGAEGAAGERDGARRRGRGRDRYRRDARDTNGDVAEGTPAEAPAETPAETPAEFVLAESVPAPEIPAPVVHETVPAPVPPAPIVVEPYLLPTDDLRTLARSAGLEWVGSDADKIAAVQAAMAAEPKPIHAPRAPKPRVVVDEGPLILVETRKDLSQLKLPFEAAPRA
jgi:ribonuclease E